MDERPKWRPECTPIDKTVEIRSWLFIIAMWSIVGAKDGGYDLSFWALPIFLAGMIGPAILAILKSLKLKS